MGNGDAVSVMVSVSSLPLVQFPRRVACRGLSQWVDQTTGQVKRAEAVEPPSVLLWFLE